MSALSTLFEQFLRERRYLKNVTPKTEAWYQSAFDALTRTVPIATPADLNKAALTSFILSLRQRGLCPVSCNKWAKALNAFFTWLHVEGHVAECLRIQPQRTEKRILQTLSEEQLRRLVTFKPKTMAQWRAYALACTLTDTGIRIEEAFGLRQGDVDYDNLLVKVRGKGRKERLVPFFVRAGPRALSVATASCTGAMAGDWIFMTAMGTRLNQRNALRAHYLLLARLDIPKSGFHRLRHTFCDELSAAGRRCRSSVAGARALADHYDDALSPSGNSGPAEAASAALNPQPIPLKHAGQCSLDAAISFCSAFFWPRFAPYADPTHCVDGSTAANRRVTASWWNALTGRRR